VAQIEDVVTKIDYVMAQIEDVVTQAD
jgi:ABC-type transporter Mla subunit MlaD